MSFIRDTLKLRKEKSKGKITQFSEEAEEQSKREGDKKSVLVRESETYPQRYARRRMLEHELRPYCAIQRKCEFFDECYDRDLGIYNWDVLQHCENPIIKTKLSEWQKKELVFEREAEEESQKLRAQVAKELKSIDIYADKRSGRWEGQTPYPYRGDYHESDEAEKTKPDWYHEIEYAWRRYQESQNPVKTSPELKQAAEEFLASFEKDVLRRQIKNIAEESGEIWDKHRDDLFEAEFKGEKRKRQITAQEDEEE